MSTMILSRLPLVRAPRLRLEADAGTRVTWLELFFDLAFVAAVAQVAAPLHADYSLHGLLRFGALFLLIWWAWVGHTVFATRFEVDDLVHRVLTLVQIFAAAVMAANSKDALDTRNSAGFAAAYAVMRFLLVTQYLRARQIEGSRTLTTRYLVGFGAAAALWVASALVPVPVRFWLWGVALLVDFGTPVAAARESLRLPPDARHLPERFGLFTIILLGEFMVAVMSGIEHHEDWSLEAALSAFLALGVGFGIWWWYFDGAHAAAERTLRSRRDVRRFSVWSYAHLPLCVGIAVAGVGLEHAVVEAGSVLHTTDAWILTSATGLVMMALIAIEATAENHHRRARPRWVATRLTMAVVTLMAGLVAHLGSPLTIVAVLAVLVLGQLAFAAS